MECYRYIRSVVEYPKSLAFPMIQRAIRHMQEKYDESPDEILTRAIRACAYSLNVRLDYVTANMGQNSFVHMSIDMDTVKESTQVLNDGIVTITLYPYTGEPHEFAIDIRTHQLIAVFGYGCVNVKSSHINQSPVTFKTEIDMTRIPTIFDIMLNKF